MKVHYPKLYNMAHLLALNVLLLPKDLTIILFAITAAGIVSCGGPKKPSPHIIHRLYFSFDPLRSVNIFGVCQIYCTLRIIFLTVF